MDLKAYYRRLREAEAAIEEDFPVVRSLATESGGRGGTLTETTRGVAARMLVNSTAELASREESETFRRAKLKAQKQAEESRRAAQIQFSVVTADDLRALVRGSGRGRKE